VRLCCARPDKSTTTRVLSGPAHSRTARTSTAGAARNACVGKHIAAANSNGQIARDARELMALS